MPIKVPDFLPAKETLVRENIFVMDESRAYQQDIRPLSIAILNLMPNKEVTETQLLRLIGNTPLQIEVTLLHPATHRAKHTDEAYLQSFYRTFEEIKEHNVDGLIITGAPIGHLPYDQVSYWEELKQIMEWSKKHVTSTLFLCWGALAGLYHHYGIEKVYDDKKTFGIFPHKRSLRNKPLMRGFDDVFWVPHSRYNYIRKADVDAHPELEILSESEETGVYLVASKDGRHVFVTGHAEYEANSLREEYERDQIRGLDTSIPENYFPNNDPSRDVMVSWRAHASLMFSNWLNYYVYQATPYDVERVNLPVMDWRSKGFLMDSRLAQIGTHSDPATGGVSFPIYNSTAFRHPGLGQSTGFDYSRSKNPTRSVLEQAIAEIESGDTGFACSTGMAALQTVFALFRTGDHLICSLDLYGGTYRMIEQILSRAGVTASYVDTNDLQAIESVAKPETKAIFIETPTNPMMMITDIRKAAKWAKARGLLTIVDNTLMTPYFQRPIELGADIVVHSATKYLGGHNDVLAGLIVTKGEKLNTEMAFLHNAIGAVLGANDSWLLMRGMKTLALRMERHEYNATMLAQYLTKHPLVENVFYPGLKIHPGYEVQKEQATGNTGIFSFRVKDSRYVAPILKHIKLINFAESLGGVESLMTYPMVQTHSNIPAHIRNVIGVDDCLLRLSAGVEHIDDLVADLSQALQKAADDVVVGGE